MNKVCPAEILVLIRGIMDYLENDQGEKKDYEQNPSSEQVYLDIQKVKAWTEASPMSQPQDRSVDHPGQGPV